MKTQSENSIEFVIEYVGIVSAPQTITLDTTLITGGKAGAPIESSVTILRDYSNRELYSPVPFDFIHVPSANPTLKVAVKSIPAVCNDCSYQFNAAATPVVASSSRAA